MKRRVAWACGAALLSGSLIGHLHAQAAAATAHVDAARAAIAPKGADPKKTPPFHVFQALFDQACQEPKLPDVMRTNDRSAVVPRKDWFTWPANIFDNPLLDRVKRLIVQAGVVAGIIGVVLGALIGWLLGRRRKTAQAS